MKQRLPVYNHTREDSHLVPCEECAAVLELLRRLSGIQEAFEQLLISEVRQYGGIPRHAVLPEQAVFRDTMATLLLES